MSETTETTTTTIVVNIWDERGIAWTLEDVRSQNGGDNASDKVVVGKGPIPTLVNVDKAIKAGLGEAIVAGINGTSWRVKAQDVIRSTAKAKDGRAQLRDVDAMKEKVYARLLSMRSVAVRTQVVEVKVRNLPGGIKYTGADEAEFRQLYVAALVDLGVPADNAMAVAQSVEW